MFTITKQFSFAAAHQLAGLDPNHPCSRLHGHNYEVELELSSPTLNAVGFVVDYRDLDAFKRYVDDRFDHRNLNDAIDFNPTAENLAKMFFLVAKKMFGFPVVAARVKETQKTCAEYFDDAE